MKRYTDFEIWIDEPATPASGGGAMSYPVRVTMSLAGPAPGTLELNLADQAFQNELSVVRDQGPDLPSRQAFGKRLFEALFRGAVRDAWKMSRGRLAAREADGLRLRLWISDPQVAALPWELLYEEAPYEEGCWGFLATAANLALSRYLPVPEPPVITVKDKLRILVVVESPSNLTLIEAEEVTKLEAALAGLGSSVEHTVLRNLTSTQIHSALLQDYHVLHFLGHGRAGKLALVEEGGTKAAYITDREFVQLVQGRSSLRLVVLNACYSSQPVDGELFAGMGPALVKMQMPAVVAMQYNTVDVRTAGRFSQAFYGALAGGTPVDFAVNEARQELSASSLLEQRDWSTPVLYMGTRQGRILVLPEEAAGMSQVDQAWQSLQAAVRASEDAAASEKLKAEQAQAAMAELARRFREVADRQQEVTILRRLATNVGAVRDAFEPCGKIVRDAGYDMSSLFTQFAQLKFLWDQMRNNQWTQLATFVTLHPGLNTSGWYQPLEAEVVAIDGDFAGAAVGSVRDRVNTFAGQLRHADIQVRFQLDEVIDDLVRVSDRTLGRIAAA